MIFSNKKNKTKVSLKTFQSSCDPKTELLERWKLGNRKNRFFDKKNEGPDQYRAQ